MTPEDVANEEGWRQRKAAEKVQREKEEHQREEQRKKEAEAHAQWLKTPEGQKWLDEAPIREAEARKQEAAAQACQEAANWQRDARLLGVPSRLVPSALYGEAIRETPALLYSRQYVEGGDLKAGASLVLLGPASRGKTFAAAAVLRAAAGWGSRSFIHFPGFVGALLDPARRPTALEAAKTTRLVILDEIGGGYIKPGGLVEPLFEEIIFWRHGEFRPTIFTSNLTGDEFSAQFSDRVIDRIREWGPVWACGGPSLRERYHPAQSVQRPEAA